MMHFSAIHTLTLLDYPGKVSAIVFTPGCNFRCHFCHNAEFVLPEKIREIQHDFIPEENILNFLRTRQGKLDGIVVSGGEPTLHGKKLLDFFQKVKELGFLVKLDTNGTNPDILLEAFERKLVDYVAMDIKAPFDKYEKLIGVKINTSTIEKSVELLRQSHIDYELRTTVIKNIHTDEMLEKIFKICKDAPLYSIQNYRTDKVLNPQWKKYTGFSREELHAMKTKAERYIQNVRVLENL